jgi:hypothetical protein
MLRVQLMPVHVVLVFQQPLSMVVFWCKKVVDFVVPQMPQLVVLEV